MNLSLARFAATDGTQAIYQVVFIDAIHVKIREGQVGEGR
jgi:transposase-like protein